MSHIVRRVKALFAQAVDLPEEERGAFLDAACPASPSSAPKSKVCWHTTRA